MFQGSGPFKPFGSIVRRQDATNTGTFKPRVPAKGSDRISSVSAQRLAKAVMLVRASDIAPGRVDALSTASPGTVTALNPEDSAQPAPTGGNVEERQPFSMRAFSIREFCRQYGIGRTHTYKQIAAGRLRAVKVGRRTLIKSEAAEAWFASLPQLKLPRSVPEPLP